MDSGARGVKPGAYRLANSKIKALTALLLLSFICLTTACGRQSAAFVIAGSTSVQPYVEILDEEYARLYPDELIDIQGGGSSAGIQAVGSDTAQLGMSSRNLKDTEQHLWSIEIAKDGLAIIVNPSNPASNLTLDQLRGVYAADVTNWSELGGPDARIHIIAREEGSGTRSAFEEMVMGGRRITPRAIIQDSNGAVRQLVSDDPYSIGFISLGLIEIGEKPVKPLRIDGIAASQENVANGSYALFRPFLFVAKEEPTGRVMQFINFVRSPEGQRILASEGLIPE